MREADRALAPVPASAAKSVTLPSSARVVTSTLALALFMAAFGISAILVKEPPPKTEYIVTKVPAQVSDAVLSPSASEERKRHTGIVLQAPSIAPRVGARTSADAVPAARVPPREVVLPPTLFQGESDNAALSEELADALASLQQSPCDPLRRARAGAAVARFRAHEFDRQASAYGSRTQNSRGDSPTLPAAQHGALEGALTAKIQKLSRMGILPGESTAALAPQDCAAGKVGSASQEQARNGPELWQPPLAASPSAARTRTE